ncbi:hypothetical protein UT300012_23480 [Paraclostridium bifermentans]
MNNLQLLKKVWDDLEATFESSKHTERLEFLHKAIGFDGESTASGYLISRLKEDTDKYNEDELEEFSKFIEMLESVDQIVMSGKLTKITNLNEFKALAMSGKFVREIEKNKMPESFLNDLDFSKSDLRIDKTFESDFKKIFGDLATVGDTTTFVGEDVISMQLADDNAYIFYNMKDVERVFEEAGSNPFFKAIGYITKTLMDTGAINQDNLFNQVFLGNKYFNVESGSINVKIGDYEYSTKVRSDNKIKAENYIAYTSSLPTNYGRFKVILVDNN